MATLFENYITGADLTEILKGTAWQAQTFTPSITHSITSVKLLLSRTAGTIGTITVSIRAVDGGGKPTGNDLCSGTTDGNTLELEGGGEWREITFDSPYTLEASTQYAIVVRAPDAINDVWWWYDNADATYTGGEWHTSSNSGSTWFWSSGDGWDLMFEEWGDEIYLKGTIWVEGERLHLIEENSTERSLHGDRAVYFQVIADDATLATGDGKQYFTVPPLLNGMNLVDADAAVATQSTSGLPTIQIHRVRGTADMLSTRITIDANEFNSYDAATPPVIDETKDDVVTGDVLRIDVDVAGTGTLGLHVVLTFRLP